MVYTYLLDIVFYFVGNRKTYMPQPRRVPSYRSVLPANPYC